MATARPKDIHTAPSSTISKDRAARMSCSAISRRLVMVDRARRTTVGKRPPNRESGAQASNAAKASLFRELRGFYPESVTYPADVVRAWKRTDADSISRHGWREQTRRLRGRHKPVLNSAGLC